MIKNMILWIWSHIPIFALSDDENFGTLTEEKIRTTKSLRFSLINFILGDQIWYFITINIKQPKVQLFYKLYLEKMEGCSISEEKALTLQQDFFKHLDSLSKDKCEIEKEALCYHIQNEEQRIGASIDKINTYATIILTILPLLLAIIDLKTIFSLPFYLLVCVIMGVYSLLNICIYIFRTIKVQGINKSTFSDLKQSGNKNKKIISQYYYDWQQLKHKANLFVSFVLNLQQWMKLLLILSIFIAIALPFEDYNKEQGGEIKNNIIITIKSEDIDKPYTESAIRWSKLILNVEEKKCNEIIFIVNRREEIETLISKLDKYRDIEVKIFIDKDLKETIVKIIQEN